MASKHQAFMHYCEAWKSSPRVAALSLEAYKGFFEILNSLWLAECLLTDDDATVLGASRLTLKQWKKAEPELFNGRKPLLRKEGGYVVNDRLFKEWERTSGLREKQSEAAHKANEIRWARERERMRQRSESDKNRSPNQIQTETETNTPPTPPWGDDFDSWWSVYPRKVSKGAALQAFKSVVVDGRVSEPQKPLLPKGFPARFEALTAGTRRRLPVFEKREPEHRPHPATFIRSLDWLTTEEAPERRERMAWE